MIPSPLRIVSRPARRLWHNDGVRYETEFEGLRLVVEARSENHWQAFVYDPVGCEVLYTAVRPTVEGAKFAVVDYAAVHAFGGAHDLDVSHVAELLSWDSPKEP